MSRNSDVSTLDLNGSSKSSSTSSTPTLRPRDSIVNGHTICDCSKICRACALIARDVESETETHIQTINEAIFRKGYERGARKQLDSVEQEVNEWVNAHAEELMQRGYDLGYADAADAAEGGAMMLQAEEDEQDDLSSEVEAHFDQPSRARYWVWCLKGFVKKARWTPEEGKMETYQKSLVGVFGRRI